MGASLSGFFHLTGWPDRPPCGPFGAYSDYPSPRFALCAVLAALDHRDRTGEGQYLDFAQAEACAHFLSPALLDRAVNGHESDAQRQRRPGDGRRTACTRRSGDDQWVALACRDDADWRALAELVGRRDLASLGTEDRLARRAELDTIVAALDRRHGHPTMSPPSLSPPACPPTPSRTPASAWTTRSWPTSGTG